MGREGGSELNNTFKTKEETEKFLANHKKDNSQKAKDYEGDKTDSGRGNACEDGGGFWDYKQYWLTDNVYESKEKAEKALYAEAEKRMGGDDSQAVVVGRYLPVKEDVQEKIRDAEKERSQKCATLRDKKSKLVGEAAFNYVETLPLRTLPGAGPDALMIDKNDKFAQCRDCGSILNMTKGAVRFTNEKGRCRVCSDFAPPSGSKSRKRERPLFTKEFDVESKRISDEIERIETATKKRKEELTKEGLESKPVFLVVDSWISAHF